MIQLLHGLKRDEADVFGLALSSAAISNRVVSYGQDEFGLWVDEGDVNRAVAVIRAYMEENRDEREVVPLSGVEAERRSFAGVWGAVALLVVHVGVVFSDSQGGVFKAYGASAAGILNGEVWRAITALTLHSNLLHLAGNMVGISLFGSAVCGICGWGVGGLIILLSGGIGNLANALFYKVGHLSIGASTAVFGALGFLAAYQFLRKVKQGRQERVKAWLPLAGGLALLAILGSGAGSDIMAHLFGFVSGSLLGAGYTVFWRRPSLTGQLVALGIFVVLLGGGWLWPMMIQ